MRIFLLFLYAMFSVVYSFSQDVNAGSLAQIQDNNTIALYNNYTDGNAAVFNGAAYSYYAFRMDGDPFFQSTNSSPGWISYKGEKYDPLYMLYDITRNQVVVLLPTSDMRAAVLHNEFVDSFQIAGHTFISLKEDHQQNLYNTGFYDVLYRGSLQLFARRTKVMTESLENNYVLTIISPKDLFYIHKKGLYYLVNNKKDVFRVLADRKSEIKKMMRRQHLKLNHKTFGSTLVSVVEFYGHAVH